jgi:hypothetical protein
MITLYRPTNTNRVYYGTDTRAAAILFGAALAAALAVYGPVYTRRARLALETSGVVGAVVLALAWTRLDGQSSTLYRGGFLVCGLAATSIIAAAVHPTRGLLARALSFTPLCALGLISYGVYLYHWPIDVVLNRQRAHLGGWPLLILQISVTLALAIASYRFIEQPIRHGALRAPRLRKLTPAVALALVVTTFAATTGAAQVQLVSVTPNQWVFFATAARRAAPVGEPRVMVVGDSVAAYIGREMRDMRSAPPVAVFDQATSGCVYPRQVTSEEFDLSDGGTHERPTVACDMSWQSRVLRAFQPQLTFLIVASPANRVAYRGRWIHPCSQPYDSLFEQDVRDEIQRIRASGSRVAVTTTAYAANDFARTDRDTDCNNRLLGHAARATGAQLVDLFHYICPDGKCRTKLHGVMLRPDGLHYQGRGGQLVSRWLLQQAPANAA